ncbi:MAG: response regulator transcription factor [Rhodobacter sp.]|nr:response regulator transcription factor [Rhodobacter sp.]MCA3461268.1 response regulator transcription factor [Rhodobacter sp.]MCA3465568.1 response regulator transcription factor [Rhodobacter sp.]MCA3466423.1 response regulator transcription factor [Rhodobacter sp.]MCA3472091.1 response regulator transcription factor [Rhodobacter sp.]
MNILIVDDDPRLRDLLRIALERAGFTTFSAANGTTALIHARREAPDLIVLDVGLPEMDGFEVCRRLRAASEVPILFLTARDEEIDRIVGLELGADDYVTKPFSPRELVARVHAILKRSGRAVTPEMLSRGKITLDLRAQSCRVAGTDIALTATEFDILARLLAEPDRLAARRALIAGIWGPQSRVSDRTFDSHLRNLRRKLAEAGCEGAIETVHGQGMRLGSCA